MTTRAQLTILAAAVVLFAILVLLAIFFPRPAASDVPVVATAVPASEFEAIRSAEPLASGLSTPGAPFHVQTPSPSASSVPSATPVRIPAPTERAVAVTAVQRGTASTYGPTFGPSWLAVPQGPGIHVRICGAARCIERTSTDTGPDRAMQRQGRIVDLSVRDFEIVCGCSWTRGLVPVIVEVVK